MTDDLSHQSCRVALAAYLHDLGKFAERAAVFEGDPRLDAHLTLYCPYREEGGRRWFTHRHAAYSALAFDLIERHLPDLLYGDVDPFVGRMRADGAAVALDPTDSIVNAAAAHHKPATFLQWVIATADRVASGFEREEFERYNLAKEGTRDGLDHYTARQLTLFEQISLGQSTAKPSGLQWRYPLRPLAASTIFPAPARECESRDRSRAKGEYRDLWEAFMAALEQIPRSHRTNLALWLDHFDTLWQTYMHAIPAATAFNVKPDVSLYDHSRSAAALAVALWRWHQARGDVGDEAASALRERADFVEPKFLLVQGDFFGIQEFVFATGGETRKQAAKLLRGRSFQVALFTEIAALRLLDELALPPTSQVLNAAGKFLIVAPNTGEVRVKLEQARSDFDAWFLEQSFGMAGIGLAWIPASCGDFLRGPEGRPSPYAELTRRLRESLDEAKHQRFGLRRVEAHVFQSEFPHGVCEYNGRLPADRPQQHDSPASCALSRDQVKIGEALLRFDRVLALYESAASDLRETDSTRPLELDLFGYVLAFTADAEASGAFGPLAASGALRRCWDISAADPNDGEGTTALWAGYARRSISGYAPRVASEDVTAEHAGRYAGIDQSELPGVGQLKTFDMLACDDRLPDASQRAWRGVSALGVLKGDIDDLGELFRVGLGNPTFAKTAALSRQINAFFAVYLPWLLARKFPAVYTVFAGGDDFFLIGPWRSMQKLAYHLREEFARYAAGNSEIHFSAAIATQKPGAPIGALAELAASGLEAAKDSPGKNAVSCFGETVAWSQWPTIESAFGQLDTLREHEELSSAFVYALLQFVELRKQEKYGKAEAAMWRSRFAYQTRRYVVDKRKDLDDEGRRRLQAQIAKDISAAIDELGSSYRIVIFNHLYQLRTR